MLASYTYGGDGTLVKKVAGGTTTYYAGSHYEKTVSSAITATPLNYGVVCLDNATGTGYTMVSEESVRRRRRGHTRFAAHPPHVSNAEHFICVKYANGWVYDNNTAYYAFTPELSDILVAAVDFSNDTVTALVGVDEDAHGIVKGYASGSLSFTANLWGGVANAGEFGLSGTQFTPNAEETKYYTLSGQRVAMARNGVVFYLHGDHLGSASLTTDASGAVVSEMRYYPYGETRSGGTPTDRRYTGQREEARLGLYDYGARYYDPVLGRFIQADSIVSDPGNPQSLNRYSYVLGNPLLWRDPSGHTPLPGAWMDGMQFRGRTSGRMLVQFAGVWSAGQKSAVNSAAWDVAQGLQGVAAADMAKAMERAQLTGENSSYFTSSLTPLWGLSERDTFRAVYGTVTFRRNDKLDIDGWAETHIDWKVGGCTYRQICYDGSMFAGAPSSIYVRNNVVHELGHAIDQRGEGRQAREDLTTAAAVDARLTRGKVGFAEGSAWQQNTGPGYGEVFADMFLGWTYGQWAPDRAGSAKAQYMEANMPRVVALALSGH